MNGGGNVQEIWKDVPGYEQFYQVSNLGRLKSKDRTIKRGLGECLIKSKTLKLQCNNHGYLYFQVKAADVHYKLYIHRAVSMAFIENTFDKPFINHKDSNPSNNQVDNLEWVTHMENMHHAINKGRFDNHFKYTTQLFKISNQNLQRAVIGTNLKTGTMVQFISIQEAGRHFNNRAGDICKCCKGERQTAQGYRWQYAS